MSGNIEQEILNNRGNPQVLSGITSSINQRLSEIDYIMHRFLEDYPESNTEELIKFETDHNNEYSQLTRLLKIAKAYE
jgi:hypothetical protein